MIDDKTSFADLWTQALAYKWWGVAIGVAFVVGIIVGAVL